MRSRRPWSLCAATRDALSAADQLTLLSALDPVNLYGGELGVVATEGAQQAEAARFARVASTHVVLYQGRPALVGEDNGTRLTAAELSDDVLDEALKLYLDRSTAPRRAVINTWNDAPVIDSRGEPLLRALGATRSPTGLDYWRAG